MKMLMIKLGQVCEPRGAVDLPQKPSHTKHSGYIIFRYNPPNRYFFLFHLLFLVLFDFVPEGLGP